MLNSMVWNFLAYSWASAMARLVLCGNPPSSLFRTTFPNNTDVY